jgi:hypothetical protein
MHLMQIFLLLHEKLWRRVRRVISFKRQHSRCVCGHGS